MRRLVTITLLLLLPAFAPAQAPPAEAGLAAADLDADARKVLADWHAPGVAIAVVKDDKVILIRGYGVREIGKPEPVDEHTVFDIASCSKAFTVAALAILVDEGKVRWTDPVTKHLPGFQLSDPYVTRELTVRDLLCHRSGLGTFAGDLVWYNTSYSRAEVVRRARFLKPTSSFRSAFGYQNILFVAAGEIVPAATGKSWDDFVADRLFKPLGMATAFTRARACPANAATPHTVKADKPIALPRYDTDNVAPAAGVHASVDDLAKWMRLQLGMGEFEGRRIYSSTGGREMWTPQTMQPLAADPTKPSAAHLKAYALGWFVSDYHGRLRVDHEGSIDGMYSQVVLLPELKAGVVALTNSDTPAAELMCNRAVDGLLGLPPQDRSSDKLTQHKARDLMTKARAVRATARAKDTKPSLPAPHYAGNYGGDLYGDVAVTPEDDKLVLRFVPAPTFVADLEHWQHDTFRVKWRTLNPYIPDGWATFVLDRRGKPAEVRLDCPNDDFDFTELELKRRP
jgi:CubicO group peptidase (beta-lactamase class C family)